MQNQRYSWSQFSAIQVFIFLYLVGNSQNFLCSNFEVGTRKAESRYARIIYTHKIRNKNARKQPIINATRYSIINKVLVHFKLVLKTEIKSTQHPGVTKLLDFNCVLEKKLHFRDVIFSKKWLFEKWRSKKSVSMSRLCYLAVIVSSFWTM